MTWLTLLLSFAGAEPGRRIARIRLGQRLVESTSGVDEVDLALAPGDNGDLDHEEQR